MHKRIKTDRLVVRLQMGDANSIEFEVTDACCDCTREAFLAALDAFRPDSCKHTEAVEKDQTQ